MEIHQQKQIKKLKRNLRTFIILVTLLIAGGLLSVQKNTESIQEKDLKISVLIDEVGTLKQRMEEKEKTFSGILKGIHDVSENLGNLSEETLQEKTEASKVVSQALAENQQKLSKLVMQKEETIRQLEEKNQRLAKEVALPPYPETMINILLLGQNAGLMDTIIVANIDPTQKTITTVSVPRDLWHEGRKINELYNSFGIEKLRQAVTEITGLPIHKYIIFDFTSFTQIVDALGGITIDVPKGFTDNQYPGPNHTYRTVSFEAGSQYMDGAKALEYARSRKSSSDFDRAARQQEVIKAIKDKIITFDLTGKIDVAMKIYAQSEQNISTDISFFDGLSYLQEYRSYQIKGGNVLSTQNYLYPSKSTSGQYILLPKEGTYASIRGFVRSLVAP